LFEKSLFQIVAQSIVVGVDSHGRHPMLGFRSCQNSGWIWSRQTHPNQGDKQAHPHKAFYLCGRTQTYMAFRINLTADLAQLF
jgi:hypothetical protein